MSIHREWAQADRVTFDLYQPDDEDHPDETLDGLGYLEDQERGWALVLDYGDGDGVLVLDGLPEDFLGIAKRIVEAVGPHLSSGLRPSV